MSFLSKKLLLIFSLALTLSFSTPTTSWAETAPPNLRAQISGNVKAGSDVAGLGAADPRVLIARVIQIALSLVGITFTLLMVISGYNLLTAAGDESKVEKSKNIIKASVIGLAITLGAYSLTTFLAKSAVQITNEAPTAPVDDRLNFDQLKNDIHDGIFDTSNNVD